MGLTLDYIEVFDFIDNPNPVILHDATPTRAQVPAIPADIAKRNCS